MKGKQNLERLLLLRYSTGIGYRRIIIFDRKAEPGETIITQVFYRDRTRDDKYIGLIGKQNLERPLLLRFSIEIGQEMINIKF